MAYDRIVRADLIHSERWLELPSDTHRLVFNMLIHEVDDFGNFEGGRRLWRFMRGFSQVKTEPDSVKLMSDLQDADLIRRYEVDGKEFWHMPRFRNTRTYWRRVFPPSPWCDAVAYTGPYKGQAVRKKSESDLKQNSFRPEIDLKSGVGVGVDLGLLGSVVDFKSEVIHSSVGSEPEKLVLEATAPPPVVSIPLNDNTEFPVTQAMVAEFERLYPAVDVPQTLNEIRGWNLSHPKQRKTRRGVLAHINTWLQREQNRG